MVLVILFMSSNLKKLAISTKKDDEAGGVLESDRLMGPAPLRTGALQVLLPLSEIIPTMENTFLEYAFPSPINSSLHWPPRTCPPKFMGSQGNSYSLAWQGRAPGVMNGVGASS
ncbi:hypothetical protein NPIL_543661 [Nephila pilipes]|uniref:Uncharacterized protein n=1 Tax=Nephila pilipes TaxID=299642 RepID=A0A8X6MUY7_NEPPI|nr:hypothetical protein NPIL_543661 [Nephila pilipes]